MRIEKGTLLKIHEKTGNDIHYYGKWYSLRSFDTGIIKLTVGDSGKSIDYLMDNGYIVPVIEEKDCVFT